MMDSSVGTPVSTNGVAAPEHAALAAPALVTLQPVSPQSQDDQQQAALRLRALFSAFRRRWIVAIFLGLLASGAAGAAVWYSIPDTYTAFSELLVEPDDRFLYTDRETRQKTVPLSTYKQTRIRLAKFPFVLTAALRPPTDPTEPHIAQLPTLRDKKDPVLWLEQNLSVKSPAEQFIVISLTSPHQNDVAPIVNAVVDAFKKEVVDVDQQERNRETQELEEHLQRRRAELKRLRDDLGRMDKHLKAANKEQADARITAQFQAQIELRKQLGQIEFQIIQTQVELERLKAEAASASDETADKGAGDDAPAESEIELPPVVEEYIDSQVELVLNQDPTFAEYSKKLIYYEAQLRAYEKRLRPGSSHIVECRQEIEQIQKQIDEYRETQSPKIKEELTAEAKKQLANEMQLAQAGLTSGNGLNLADTPDPVATAERQLALLQARKDGYLANLQDEVTKTNDLAGNWVDRELKAEEVAKVKAEVDELESIVRKRTIEAQHSTSPITVKRPATRPSQADIGKRMKMAGAAGLGLFALVVAGVVLLEYSAHRLNSVNEVQFDLNLPVMSTIPLMPRWVNSESGNTRNRRSEYWHSVLTESVDATRTLLLRHAHVNSTKVVMIASATGGEGKTTLACHLATSLARAGREVLLIDGDIRRPTVHRVFDLKSRPGLCEVLTGQVEFPDALHPVSPAGLTVLTAGRVDANALRVLAQDKFGQLMDVARNQYDFIILDTSPILPVTDALLMAQFMDGVLFSLRRDVSRAAKVSAAVQRVSMLGVNVLGAVAIGLDEGSSKSRYSYYSAYGNGTYGYGVYGQNLHVPNPTVPPRNNNA